MSLVKNSLSLSLSLSSSLDIKIINECNATMIP